MRGMEENDRYVLFPVRLSSSCRAWMRRSTFTPAKWGCGHLRMYSLGHLPEKVSVLSRNLRVSTWSWPYILAQMKATPGGTTSSHRYCSLVLYGGCHIAVFVMWSGKYLKCSLFALIGSFDGFCWRARRQNTRASLHRPTLTLTNDTPAYDSQ